MASCVALGTASPLTTCLWDSWGGGESFLLKPFSQPQATVGFCLAVPSRESPVKDPCNPPGALRRAVKGEGLPFPVLEKDICCGPRFFSCSPSYWLTDGAPSVAEAVGCADG